MRISPFLLVSALFLTACGPTASTGPEGDVSSIPSEEDTWHAGMENVYGDDAALSQPAGTALPAFFEAIGFPEFATLTAFGGTQEPTEALCRKLVEQFKQAHPNSSLRDRCGELAAGQSADFLTFDLHEFEQKHLFLLVRQEGEGGENLLAAAYNLETGAARPVDLTGIDVTGLYYDSEILFFGGSDELAEELPAGFYDFVSGQTERFTEEDIEE